MHILYLCDDRVEAETSQNLYIEIPHGVIKG